jgi:hypothetical protein
MQLATWMIFAAIGGCRSNGGGGSADDGSSADDGAADDGSAGDGSEGDGSADDGTGGDGTGSEGTGDDGGTTGSSVTVRDVASECDGDTGGGTRAVGMSASVEDGDVHVLDWVSKECCWVFAVDVTVSDAKHWVTAEYENVGDVCDCMCTYEVSFVIEGLLPGAWTIEVPSGATADVEI